MPHHYPLPTLLQFPRRLRQEPGISPPASTYKTPQHLPLRPLRAPWELHKALPTHPQHKSSPSANNLGEPVLAPPDNIHLLRPPLPGPPLPRLLPATLLAPARRILRPQPRPLLLAAPLLHDPSPPPLPPPLNPLPRLRPLLLARLHLVAAEPGNAVVVSRVAGIYGAVFAVGADGVFAGAAWDGAQG